MRALLHLSAVPVVCALSMPANAQLLEQKAIPAAMALTIAQVAMDTCRTNGYRVSVSLVGRTGELLLQVRGDGTGPHTMENSFRKAYTSRTFRSSSGDFAKRLKDNPQLPLIHLTNVIAAQGALPIMVGEDVLGAVGVSGAPGGEKDEVCAKAGIDKVADQLKERHSGTAAVRRSSGRTPAISAISFFRIASPNVSKFFAAITN